MTGVTGQVAVDARRRCEELQLQAQALAASLEKGHDLLVLGTQILDLL